MQRDKRESHAQGLAIIQQLATVRERQINAQIRLKLRLSEELTDWTIVRQCRIGIRRGRRPMMVAVITRTRLGREMVSTRKKVQAVAKHRDSGENA